MQTATTLTPRDQEMRQGRITSSRIVRLYRGDAMAVWNDMQGLSEVKDNERMAWGRRLESVIIDAAAERRGWDSARVVKQPGTVANGRYATSLDAAIRADGALTLERVIEAKNRALDQLRRYPTDEATEEEIVQCQWHMMVTGIPEATVCVLIGGNDLRLFDLLADEETQAGLREMADRFLRDHIDAGKPPPIDGSDAAADYLRATFPREREPVLTADAGLEQLVAAYHHACAAYDAAEEAKSAAGNLLRQAIGNAAGVKGANFSVSYKASKDRMVTNWEALVRDLPSVPADLLAKHTVTKPGPRSLRVSWKGE
mgnify:CR=1 FL=1|jgi:predicted phage-related endonuclease